MDGMLDDADLNAALAHCRPVGIRRGVMLAPTWWMVLARHGDVHGAFSGAHVGAAGLWCMVMPTHTNGHWWLLVLDKRRKACVVLDSTKRECSEVTPLMRGAQRAAAVLADTVVGWRDVARWACRVGRSPQQTDAVNCGVFVLDTACRIANGMEPATHVRGGDISVWREHIRTLKINH